MGSALRKILDLCQNDRRFNPAFPAHSAASFSGEPAMIDVRVEYFGNKLDKIITLDLMVERPRSAKEDQK